MFHSTLEAFHKVAKLSILAYSMVMTPEWLMDPELRFIRVPLVQSEDFRHNQHQRSSLAEIAGSTARHCDKMVSE